ncbi:MAG: hypothetical protein ACI86H_000965 [bacterium]|jgi:uncharacterized protein YutD
MYSFYADITMAVAIQMIKPVDAKIISIGKNFRKCWTQDKLAKEFSDLLQWRDELYEEYR